jgi:hypothetical protein
MVQPSHTPGDMAILKNIWHIRWLACACQMLRSNVAEWLTVIEHAKISSHFRVSNLILQLNWWWMGEHWRHACLDLKTIRNFHMKFMMRGLVADTKRGGHPLTSQSPNVVETVWCIFDGRPSKSPWKEAKETGVTLHGTCSTLKHQLKFHVQKPHAQQLFPDYCIWLMEVADIMLGWLKMGPICCGTSCCLSSWWRTQHITSENSDAVIILLKLKTVKQSRSTPMEVQGVRGCIAL